MRFHLILFILEIWLLKADLTAITIPMNGNYTIANPPPHTSSTRSFHRGKYIDVYSHNISTVYSQVYWTMQPDIPLPTEFVSEFKDKVVALTGYEVDSVRTFANGSEQHVPLYEQYNHHHNAYLTGAATTLVDVGPVGSSWMPTHGMTRSRWELRSLPKTSRTKSMEKLSEIEDVIPTAAFIVDGNGGEYRKSLHATHKNTAMLVQSPKSFRLQPMMINTKNPAQGKGPGQWDLFPSGAYGRSRGATAPKNSLYSPLLECPCTDRKKKVITSHNTLENGTCATLVNSSKLCFASIADLGMLPIVKNKIVSETNSPAGCFVKTTIDGYEAFYNTMNSTTKCGPTVYGPIHSKGFNRAAGVNISIILNEDSKKCEHQPKVITGEWKYMGDPYGQSYSKRSPPYAVTATPISGKTNNYIFKGTNVCRGPGCQGVFDKSNMRFTMKSGFQLTATVSADWSTMKWSNNVIWRRRWKCPGNATIAMSGPSAAWFGVGFDADTMTDQPYSIIIDSSGKVQERRIGNHEPGTELNQSVHVVNHTVIDGIRTITLTRTLIGATPQHFTFDAGASGIPFISAVGNTPELAYHKARAGAALMLVEVGSPMCVCSTFGQTSGSIAGVPFHVNCQPDPISDLLRDKNDVCDIKTYEGGLKCCSHNSILLDKNQTIPTEIDTYRMKFRIYYEPYTNQSNAFFMFWTNEQGAGEYEVPQCKKGEKTCVHTTTSTFRVRDSMRKCSNLADVWCAPGWDENKDVMILRAGMHCHAPACINETLYNAETGEVICFNKPLIGNGSFPESGQTFNEKAYAVGIPPCLWGSKDEGLLPPPQFSLDTKLRSVKHVNNTYYHFGVMAQWQMRGMWVPRH